MILTKHEAWFSTQKTALHVLTTLYFVPPRHRSVTNLPAGEAGEVGFGFLISFLIFHSFVHPLIPRYTLPLPLSFPIFL
jgi:hypothetical protein